MKCHEDFFNLLAKRLLRTAVARSNFFHRLFCPADEPVAVRDRIQLNHRRRRVGDVGQHRGYAGAVLDEGIVGDVSFEADPHVLLLHNGQRLLPTEIRDLGPPVGDALGKNIFLGILIFRSSNSENWMIGIDA